jgi:mono/diheme cytochrome c family protein
MLKSKESGAGSREPGAGGKRGPRILRLLLIACCLLAAAGCRQDMQDQPRSKVYRASAFFKDGLSSRPLVEGTVPRGFLRDDVELYTGKIDRNRSGAQASGVQNEGRAAGTDAATPQGQTASPQNAAGNQSPSSPGGTTQASGVDSARTSTAAGTPTGSAASAAQGDPNDVSTFPFPITSEVVNRGQERFRIYCAMCHGETGYGDGMIVRRGFRKPPSYHTDALRNARVGHFFDVITNGWGSMPSYNAQIPVRDRWAIIAYIRALQLSQQGATAAATDASAQPGAQGPNNGGPK